MLSPYLTQYVTQQQCVVIRFNGCGFGKEVYSAHLKIMMNGINKQARERFRRYYSETSTASGYELDKLALANKWCERTGELFSVSLLNFLCVSVAKMAPQ
jgi:hypothetical protein